MLNAARLLLKEDPDLQFVLPLAPTLTAEQRQQIFDWEESPEQSDLGHVHRLRFVNDARAALHHARASIVASGTATVEAALIGNPFVVVYRVSPLTYAIAKRVVSVPHVAMVNLIAQKRVIPELIQNDFTASNIVSALLPLLPDGTPRQSMMKELAELRGMLQAPRDTGSVDPTAGAEGAVSPTAGGAGGGGAIARVAKITLELLGGSGKDIPSRLNRG